jgi:hypothetical protein
MLIYCISTILYTHDFLFFYFFMFHVFSAPLTAYMNKKCDGSRVIPAMYYLVNRSETQSRRCRNRNRTIIVRIRNTATVPLHPNLFIA